MTDLKKYPEYPKAKVTIGLLNEAYYGTFETYHPELTWVRGRLSDVYCNEPELIKDAPRVMRKLISRMLYERQYPKEVEIDLTPEPEPVKPVKQPGLFARIFGVNQ